MILPHASAQLLIAQIIFHRRLGPIGAVLLRPHPVQAFRNPDLYKAQLSRGPPKSSLPLELILEVRNSQCLFREGQRSFLGE